MKTHWSFGMTTNTNSCTHNSNFVKQEICYDINVYVLNKINQLFNSYADRTTNVAELPQWRNRLEIRIVNLIFYIRDISSIWNNNKRAGSPDWYGRSIRNRKIAGSNPAQSTTQHMKGCGNLWIQKCQMLTYLWRIDMSYSLLC